MRIDWSVDLPLGTYPDDVLVETNGTILVLAAAEETIYLIRFGDNGEILDTTQIAAPSLYNVHNFQHYSDEELLITYTTKDEETQRFQAVAMWVTHGGTILDEKALAPFEDLSGDYSPHGTVVTETQAVYFHLSARQPAPVYINDYIVKLTPDHNYDWSLLLQPLCSTDDTLGAVHMVKASSDGIVMGASSCGVGEMIHVTADGTQLDFLLFETGPTAVGTTTDLGYVVLLDDNSAFTFHLVGENFEIQETSSTISSHLVSLLPDQIINIGGSDFAFYYTTYTNDFPQHEMISLGKCGEELWRGTLTDPGRSPGIVTDWIHYSDNYYVILGSRGDSDVRHVAMMSVHSPD